MPHLRDLSTNRIVPLRKSNTVLGRASDCDVLLDDPGTSLHHAAVVLLPTGYAVRDLRSTNGTLLNDRRVTEDSLLRPGDQLRLPGKLFRFEADESLAATPLPVASPDDSLSVLSSVHLSEAGSGVAAEAKLKAVLEIANNLARSLDLGSVLPKILESLFAIFPQADRGFVILRDAQTGRLVSRAVRERRPVANAPSTFSRTVAEHALQSKMAVLSADAARDDRFNSSTSIRELNVRAVMCVPMFGQGGQELGVIQLDAVFKFGRFAPADLDVLACASLLAARALELAQLYEERRDIEAATKIQKSFLPSARPDVPDLGFFDHYAAARQVSGDYFDYVRLPGNRLAVVVGDVTGKGFPAALLMARLSAAVRFCLATEPTPAAALKALNATMMQSGETGRFVTLVAAVLDLDTFTLTVVNAGHPPPIRRSAAGAVEDLGQPIVGIPLGVFNQSYEQAVFRLEPGDAIVLYTDGVTEARNDRQEMYGFARLRAAVAQGPADPAGLGRVLLDDVTKFGGGRPLADDLTLVCIGRHPASN